eukprot:gene19877-26577_t
MARKQLPKTVPGAKGGRASAKAKATPTHKTEEPTPELESISDQAVAEAPPSGRAKSSRARTTPANSPAAVAGKEVGKAGGRKRPAASSTAASKKLKVVQVDGEGAVDDEESVQDVMFDAVVKKKESPVGLCTAKTFKDQVFRESQDSQAPILQRFPRLPSSNTSKSPKTPKVQVFQESQESQGPILQIVPIPPRSNSSKTPKVQYFKESQDSQDPSKTSKSPKTPKVQDFQESSWAV